MNYTASEAAKKLGLTKDGLRYYEKEGLVPAIRRNDAGHRMYSESDIEWLYLIRCLRDTDMPIAKIKEYVSLLLQGGSESLSKRRTILQEHQDYILKKMQTYQQLSQMIDQKITFYDHALESKDPAVTCMNYNDEWEQFKSLIRGAEND
ncbi:MerR family transcriptional regulator [Enterococcus florum]|uniref:MerR family transcriptional regulator n=1 Tax=Enterococcus florum TaxID=2480627 RepID=A0A4P5PEQ9_9ENTE|nr:MerR family transcriptional regulator [Enterococcus florum]GCF94132.1 MerR family transcriptional regulator [Enterococcus florum]